MILMLIYTYSKLESKVIGLIVVVIVSRVNYGYHISVSKYFD